MNLPPDRYCTKANTELDEREERDIHFQFVGDAQNTVQERSLLEVFFSVILSSERSLYI